MARSHKKAIRYPRLTLLILVLLASFAFADTGIAQSVLAWVGGYGYLGALIAGAFSVSLFTVAPALVVLVHLAAEFDPILLSITAGVGAAVGDFILFRFIRDGLFAEIKHIFGTRKFTRGVAVLKNKYTLWLSPVIGACIIASPFPDEIGIGLMGLSRVKEWQFVIISFVLNTFGTYGIVTVARAVVA